MWRLVTISLDPLKNKEAKQSIKLNDLVSKVHQTSICQPLSKPG